MTLLLVSFVAGVLTVLAPCVLPLLPVVIGSSVSGRSRSSPYVVVLSLAISIIAFTYLLKVSSLFITVPQETWTYLSGGILVLFGLTLIFPALWESLPGLSKLSADSNKLVGSGYQKKSAWGDILIGAALGPVFSTCSPTYFVILASVLPASFALGTTYLLAYVLGLSLMLLLVGVLGQRFADRLTNVSDPRGLFKRGIGVLFVALGLLIITGYEAVIETAILNSGLDITKVEQVLLKNVPTKPTLTTAAPSQGDTLVAPTSTESMGTKSVVTSAVTTGNYPEIADPAGFVNTKSITLKELVGKKVILVDFLTYSCINCQRTFPYMNAWYQKYKDEGLEIVGIHTPEFAFEKDLDNVKEAMQRFGIMYPVVLDNNYATWNAFGNQYWPRKYLIDIHGNVVYDHIGEGGYEETEMKIQELLAERAKVLNTKMPDMSGSLAVSTIPVAETAAASPETYFGSMRNVYLGNGKGGAAGEQTFTLPQSIELNTLYLGGKWNIVPEYAQSAGDTTIVYEYNAKDVYLVASANTPLQVEVFQDDKLIGVAAGADVNANGIVTVQTSRLYSLVHNSKGGVHTLKLKVKGAGLQVYTFTFG